MHDKIVPIIDNGLDLESLNAIIKTLQADQRLGQCKFRARNVWTGGTRNASEIKDFYCAGQDRMHPVAFELRADEPTILGGTDKWANPVEYLLHALAACVTTTMVAHAAVRGIEIRAIESELEGDIDLRGFMGLDEKTPKGFTKIRILFKVDADPKNLEKLKDLATFSPVFNTITKGAAIDIRIEQK